MKNIIIWLGDDRPLYDGAAGILSRLCQCLMYDMMYKNIFPENRVVRDLLFGCSGFLIHNIILYSLDYASTENLDLPLTTST